MSTTLTWLQEHDWAHLAFTVAIDGHRTIYTTTAASDAMLTAYAGTDYTACVPNLDILGETKNAIGLLDPRVEAETLTLRLLEDDAGALLGTFLRPWSTDDKKTYLAADLDCDDTTIPCQAVSTFTSDAPIWIGHECVTFTGTTTSGAYTTGFTGCTRGVAALGETSTGASFGKPHLIDRTLSADYQSAPTVTNAPRTWYNREVCLRVHHEEGGTWSTMAAARIVWVGRIKSWRDDGDGWVTLECRDIRERLHASAFPQQWSGEIAEGAYLPADQASMQIGGSVAGAAYSTASTLSTSEAVYSWRAMFDACSTVCDAATTSSVRLDVQYVQTDDGPRVQFVATRQAGNFSEADPFAVRLNPLVLYMLGFLESPEAAGSLPYDAEARLATMLTVPMSATSTRKLTAKWAPVLYPHGIGVGSSVVVSNARGTWSDQPAGTLPSAAGASATGVVRLGDYFYGASLSGSTLSLHARFVHPQGGLSDPGGDRNARVMREGDGKPEIPRARQVWWTRGPVGTTMLRLLLSTGTAGYNHPDYDVYGVGVGLGLPASYVDAASFEALDSWAGQYDLVIDGPEKFSDLLEGVCAFLNRYPILDNGQLKLIAPPTENLYDAGIIRLTEDNKATPADRIRVSYAVDGIVTQATVKYGRDWLTGESDEETIVFDSVRSALSDGAGSKLKVDGRGFDSIAPWHDSVLPMLPYFQRPPAICTRTINASLIDLVPGSLVAVDDDHLASPTDGVRGVTQLPGWVLSTSFDWRSGVGRVEFVYAGLGALWAPSARVDDTATGGGYVAGTKTLTCYPHAYSTSTDDTVDAARFQPTYAVRVVRLDPADPAAPTTWTDVVASQSGNTIVLTTGLAGFSAGGRYIVEADDAATVADEQLARASFLADVANQSTGHDTDDAYHYGSDISADSAAVPALDYATGYARPYNLADDAGEPVSTHKIANVVQAANNYLGRRSCQTLLCDHLDTPVDNSAAKTTTSLMYGPVPVPIYGAPDRPLKFRLRGRTSTADRTATLTLRCASGPVTGAAVTALVYPPGGTTSEAVTVGYSATATWTSEATVVPVLSGQRPPITWITIEGLSQDSSTVAYLEDVYLAEEVLT